LSKGGDTRGGSGSRVRVPPNPEERRPTVLGPRAEARKSDHAGERAKRLMLVLAITPEGENPGEMAMKIFGVRIIKDEAGLCAEDLENTDRDEALFMIEVALRRIVDKYGDGWLPNERPSSKREFVYFVERLRARVGSAANELADTR